MAEFKQIFEEAVQLSSTVSIYCKKYPDGKIDHAGGSRNPASQTITFNTSEIDVNATIDSVNFSFTKTVGGNTVGNNIIYISESNTDTIIADNDSILQWLNNNKKNNSYPNLTLNFWVKATGIPSHSHTTIAGSSTLITGNTKVTYDNITLTVSYHLNINETLNSPNVYNFYIKDNFRELNSVLNGATSFEGGNALTNSFGCDIKENCLFSNLSKLTFSSTAVSNQSYDKTIIYNLILTQETNGGARVIIYNQTQDNGYFSIPQDIFSNLTFSYPLTNASGDTLIGGNGERISFSYCVKDVANKITEIHGFLYFLESQLYTRPKINNFSISKNVSSDNTTYLAVGTYDIVYSNIPIVLKTYGGSSIRVMLYNTIQCIQKVYNINGEEVGAAIENNSSQANNQLFSNSYLRLGADYNFTLTFSDSFFSGSSSIVIKAEDVFLNIETAGVSIGRQVSIGEENNPFFEVYFPSIFNSSVTFNDNLIFGGSSNLNFDQPITFGDDVTFKGDLIFSGSSNLDFSQPIMATGGITVGATGVNNPSGATFNGAATFKKEVTFEDAVTFNSSLQFDNAIFSSASIQSGGTLSIAEGATLDVSGSSTFTKNITATGGLTVGSSTDAKDATFYGEAIFKKGVTFEDNATFLGDLQFNNASFSNLSVSEEAIFGGATTFNKGITVGGTISVFNSLLQANQGLTVFGNTSTFTTSTSFTGETTFDGSVIFNKEVTFSGTDALTFSSPIIFNDSATFNNSVIFNSSLQFDSASFSSASINSGGSLTIASDASLNAYGSSIFLQNINAFGGITVGSSAVATFDGSANFNNQTTFNKAAIFKKGVTFEDAVTFSGTDTLIFNRPVTFSNSTNFSATAQFNSGATFNGSAIFNSAAQFNGGISFSNADLQAGGTLTIPPATYLTVEGIATFDSSLLFIKKSATFQCNGPAYFKDIRTEVYGTSLPSSPSNNQLFFKIVE